MLLDIGTYKYIPYQATKNYNLPDLILFPGLIRQVNPKQEMIFLERVFHCQMLS